MIPKEILEKAIEGEWKEDLRYKTQYPEVKKGSGDMLIWYVDAVNHEWTFDRYSFQQIALDPLFWQALGKSLLWSDGASHVSNPTPEWMENAHRFYDLILTGQPTDTFWADLLSDKTQ